MDRLKFFITHIIVWFRRFRKRKGYGVHSPFVFGLITNVVYEKAFYYAYKDLEPKRKNLPKKFRNISRKKIDQLLFRLANFSKAKDLMVVGDVSPLSKEYIAEARLKSVDMVYQLHQNDFKDTEKKNLFLFIGQTDDYTQFYDCAKRIADSKSMIVVDGIYRNKEINNWWKTIISSNEVVISLDLYDLGIILFDNNYNKENYIVNF